MKARISLLVGFTLAAVACGSSDDPPTAGSGATELGSEQADSDAVESSEPEGSDSEEPARGGRLVYAIEADSANAWAPFAVSCAPSCEMVLRSVTDPLFVTGETGELVPYLAESVAANDDLTVWTVTVREGVKFHDGTPLDGAAVKYNLDMCRAAPSTAARYSDVAEVTADGLSATIVYAQPNAIGARSLRNLSCGGMMFSPTWLSSLDGNPLNADLSDEDRSGLTGDPTAPVGLGAFEFVSYTPGPGNSFVAKRYEDYWRGNGPDSLTGEGLPYLDEIEFVVSVDTQARSNGLRSGEFDIMHTRNAQDMVTYVDDEDFTLIASNDYADSRHILLNNAEGTNPALAEQRGVDVVEMDPAGSNVDSPFLQKSCRRALAHAIDLERLSEERFAGLYEPANGPFPPGSVGYLEDTGYPEFDVQAAEAEWETCKSDLGEDQISFSYTAGTDPFNLDTLSLIISMWSDVFGDEIDVSLVPTEQGQVIGIALTGNYEAFDSSQFGAVDPGENWYWWSSTSSVPIGEVGLNFGRFQDPVMDEAMTELRTSSDPEARRAAAEAVNRQFGENAYYLWTTWATWGIVADERVRNVAEMSIPDQAVNAFPVVSGRHNVTEIWCVDGRCGE